jgi:hypothetical protein
MNLRSPKSVRTLEDFTRVRLSTSFFMREFLYSEIATIEGMRNQGRILVNCVEQEIGTARCKAWHQ